MINFNKFVSAGIALAGSTVVLGSSLSAAPAQAYNIIPGSTIDITGKAVLSSSGTLLSLSNSTVKARTGGFTASGPGLLTDIAVGSSVITPSITLSLFPNAPTYKGSIAAGLPLFKFPNANTVLEFFLTNPTFLVFTKIGSTYVSPPFGAGDTFAGVFKNTDGTFAGEGALTFQKLGNGGSYSATIAVVPEPFTILGTATALGFGAFLKNKKKKEENQASA
jgi:hypothetical protein